MSRLCWSTRETKVYLAIGKGCYGFSWSSSSISHLWSYEGFLEDVRVVVEGITGLLAISSGRSIHILDPYTPVKPRVSWMDAHKDTIYAMHFDPQTGVLFSSGKDRCIKAWEVLNEELSLMGTAPEAHQNWVMAIQFNPQNRLMITAGVDGLVRAWRFDSSGNFSALATSEEVHADGILSLCSNMASNISISSGKDGCLQLWRYQPGTLRMVACEADCNHQGWVRGLQFDPSSGLVVSSGDDGAIRVFRYKEECFTAIAEMLEAHPSGILGLQFCSKTMRVLSAGEDGSVRYWALDCDAKNIVLQGKVEDAHDGKTVSHIQYDSRSKLVVTAGSDLHLRAWLLSDDLTFTAMASCQGEGILALQLDSEEDICYCAHADSSITVWQVDVGQGQLRHIATEADAHSGRILAFSFTQVSKMLWTAGVDKAIRAWQLQGQELRMVSRSTQFLNSGVLALAYDAKTGIVLSAGMRGDIKAWRHSGDRLVPIELESVDHSEGLLMLQFAGSTVISGGLDGALRAWRLTLASVKRVNEPMKAHQGWSRAIHYDLKNGYVASCGDDGHVKAWTLDGETLRPAGSALGAHPDGARGVLINGGHGLVLSCGDDGVIKALKMTDWASELVSSGDHPGPVFNLQYFDPQVVSCSVDGTIKAWKMDREGALKFHAQSAEESRPTLAMKYDPSTRTIFTAGFDGAVQVWRLEDHGITLLSSIQAHEGTIRTMQFDRPARTLVTAGEDGALRAWRFKDGKLAKLAVLEEAVGSEIHVIAYLGRKNMVIAACADASLRAWEMVNKTFKEVCKVETAHVNVINAMHYNAELSTIFTACHSVRIWKFESKLSELHHLPTPFGQHSVTALRYSHALSLLVGCSTTGAISSWFYCGSGPPLALWQVESAHVRGTVSVVFDSHRSLLLTGGNDKTLKTWRLLGDLQFICAATESGKSKIFTACPKQFEW